MTRAPRAQPAGHRRRLPARRADLRHRRVGLGQVDAGQRRSSTRRVATRLHSARQRRRARTRGIDGLEQLDKVIDIDQSPIGRTPRSNPATYTGAVRRTSASSSPTTPEAKVRGYKPGRFSLQRQGRPLRGLQGRRRDQASRCTSCPTSTCPARPARASATTARRSRSTSRARHIAEVLDMSVERGAATFFEQHAARSRAGSTTLHDVGLGYIQLGQPATTLSGGEAQRVKLATELLQGRHRAHALHPRRADHGPALRRHRELLEVLQRLVDPGNTVVVIEHNLDVIKSRRLGHRPRPRGRRRGRRGDRDRHARDRSRPSPPRTPGASSSRCSKAGRSSGAPPAAASPPPPEHRASLRAMRRFSSPGVATAAFEMRPARAGTRRAPADRSRSCAQPSGSDRRERRPRTRRRR